MTEEERHDERQRELVRLWQATGDQAAMQELIDGVRGLIFLWVKRTKSFSGVPKEDIVSAATLGVIEAARRFDPERGTKFSGAVWTSIQESVHNTISVSVSPATMGKSRRERAMRHRGMPALVKAMGQGVDEEEAIRQAAQKCGVPVQDFEAMLMAIRPMNQLLVDAEDNRFIAQTDTEREIILRSNRDKILSIVAKVLRLHPERMRESFIKRYIRKPAMDVRELSEEYGVSCQSIRLWHDPILEDIRYRVQKAGLNISDFI